MISHNISILTITGSDSTGGAGIQADINTITALGGKALSAITSVTVQTSSGIHHVHQLPTDLVVGQVKAIISDAHPKAVKIGLVHDAETVRQMRDEVIACRHIVCDPGILSSKGERLADNETIDAMCRYILPETTLLVLKCSEAEIVLGTAISTDADMLDAARRLSEMGAQWVMLRGGMVTEGRLTALLYGAGVCNFFSSYNIEGWQRHGVGGALSTAIATRLAFGDDVPTAISNAHAYIHSQVVYAATPSERMLRPADLYNQLMSLVAAHYHEAHDVAYYADRLAITPRYLSQITSRVAARTPKQVIDGYITQEARQLLATSRLTVQQIAQRIGFTSQTMFSKFFHHQTGMSPTQFRSQSLQPSHL